MLKSICTGAAAVAVVVISAASPVLAASAPVMHGRAAVLLDGVSGQVLYQENATDRNFPASTTKILTALVALEHGDLDQIITVTPDAVDVPPDSSTCWLEAGEQQSLEYLLYGMLLPSGNDCAKAIAEGVSQGHPDQFITWMNEKAKALGATGSQFTNPHGYHDPNHYTTALDLALIGRAAFTNPTIVRISGTEEFYWPGKSEKNGTYYNNNEMLVLDPTTIAGKTGFTEEAGRTLVNAARRGDRLLIGVLMGEEGSASMYQDMIDLLEYGFSDFTQQELLTAGTYPSSIPVKNGQILEVPVTPASDFRISVPNGQTSNITTRVTAPAELSAPVQAGQTVGRIEVMEGDRLLATVPLVAEATVPAVPLYAKVTQRTLAFSGKVLKWLAVGAAALLLVRFSVRLVRGLRRRRRGTGVTVRRVGARRTGVISSYRPRSHGQ